MHGFGRLKDHYDEDTIKRWRAEGLTDVEADHVATYFFVHPMQIWTGWIAAGLDYEDEADAA